MTTDIGKRRGRPRRFDLDEAIAVAQQLFHARGYDAVNITDITAALGINPPSFYAAFGNKAGLYTRILERYARTGAVPLTDLLRADQPVAECLGAVLEEAARRYAVNPGATGCMVLEGIHSSDAEAHIAACAVKNAAEHMIRSYIADRHPDVADELTDFVSTTMAGMSTQARNGHSLNRLIATARLAAMALAQALRT
ncbi:TetR/AcrR family transcriptional regulator [Robbsia andropogonis]|uniref:TetR/AcrR family transcriptional regulator n=1 Tax=Robbsia andropogonis TaxID=28092 RepID=UPI000465FB3C|nr:TetR/AcrR family transcriptional regulator [Robbsia andropogonis]